MLEKYFVPYEQALELKELGFGEECFKYYIEGECNTFEYFDHDRTNSTLQSDYGGEKECTAPMYVQVFEWFRAGYDLHSYIEGAYPWFIYYINSEDDRYKGYKHLIYQEAELYCLKHLIEIIKNRQSLKNI